MSGFTFYEVAEEYQKIVDLIDDLTDPAGAPCPDCNPEGEPELLYGLRATADSIHCETCGTTGRVEMTDESLLEALSYALDDIEDNVQTKAENIVRLLQSWDMTMTAIKEEETRLRDRRKTYEKRTERLRAYVLKHMQVRDIKKIETPLKNITRRAGRDRVIIDDVDALPQGTFDTIYTIKPDKKLIMDRHKQGLETEGAHIEKGEESLMIR